MNGFVDAARLVAGDLGGGALAERVQLLAVRGPNAEGMSTAEVADVVGRMADGPVAERLRAGIRASRLRGAVEGISYLVLESPIDLLGLTASTNRSERIAAALGHPMLLGEVRSSVAELRRACLEASLGELSAGTSALELRVAGWVAALSNYPRADLVSTTKSYIRHQGKWEVAARELGVHRNSLRHRVGIVTSLIGADLDDPDVSSPLWLALRAL